MSSASEERILSQSLNVGDFPIIKGIQQFIVFAGRSIYTPPAPLQGWGCQRTDTGGWRSPSRIPGFSLLRTSCRWPYVGPEESIQSWGQFPEESRARREEAEDLGGSLPTAPSGFWTTPWEPKGWSRDQRLQNHRGACLKYAHFWASPFGLGSGRAQASVCEQIPRDRSWRFDPLGVQGQPHPLMLSTAPLPRQGKGANVWCA